MNYKTKLEMFADKHWIIWLCIIVLLLPVFAVVAIGAAAISVFETFRKPKKQESAEEYRLVHVSNQGKKMVKLSDLPNIRCCGGVQPPY
jgi:exosome complex RNA-binding protein Rrp42 (RNase PH superfamily)